MTNAWGQSSQSQSFQNGNRWLWSKRRGQNALWGEKRLSEVFLSPFRALCLRCSKCQKLHKKKTQSELMAQFLKIIHRPFHKQLHEHWKTSKPSPLDQNLRRQSDTFSEHRKNMLLSKLVPIILSQLVNYDDTVLSHISTYEWVIVESLLLM